MSAILPTRPATALPAPAPAPAPLSAVIGAAIRATLQWRLLLLWALLLLLPTLAVTLPVWQMLGESLDQSVQAATLAHALDMTAVSDLMQVFKRYNTAVGNGALVGIVLTLLLSPLLSGMTIAAARAPGHLGLGALLAGGMREYGRLLRMLIWAGVPLGIAFALGSTAAGPLRSLGHNAVLETTAQYANWAGTLAIVILMGLAHVTVDAGRAILAADRRKTSAVRAWCDGVMLVLRRPVATLVSYIAITLAGLALTALVALVRVRVAPIDDAPWAAALVLTQLAVMAVAWMRAARLFALIALVRKTVATA